MAPYLRGIREGVRGWRIQPGSRMAVSLIVSALMVLAACGSQAAEVPASSAAAASEPVTEQVATPEPSPTDTPTTPPTPAASPTEEVQEFSGEGDDVVNVELQGGLVFFDLSHSGSSNLVMWLRGESDDLLVNQIGQYTGTTARGVDDGQYVVAVEADGEWSLTIREPREQASVDVPTSSSGTGDGVTAFVSLDGLHTIKASHSGDSNFTIWLYGEDGKRLDLVVNEIGDYEGTNSVRVSEGVYLLIVTADGDWSVEIS